MNDNTNQAPGDRPIQRIVVVGGGSAGWITAGLIASEHGQGVDKRVSVTLVESPDVRTIGVGEGTWPTMRGTLRRIGLPENRFLRHCAASFKQGTKFVGWATGKPNESYYHPFAPPAGYGGGLNLVPHWQAQSNGLSFVDAVTPQGRICDQDLAPKQDNTPEYAAVVNYGYHLDAGEFAELLREHCTERLGVRHVLDHVTAVNGARDEDIRSVTTARHGELPGDLFIDCTGFSSLLLGEHYGVPFRDRNDVLFNDRALAVQVPYRDETRPIASQTISAAQDAGWIWDIGLTTRRGIGYTYSSRHATEEQARESLAAYIKRTSHVDPASLEPRPIRFRPGHRETFWRRNCVAVGLSAGFLEPLEASALVMIELAARTISDDLPLNRAVMDVVANRFNETFSYRWDRIIDFLKLHYVLSRREDTSYWIEMRARDSIPESLRDLLALWECRAPEARDLPRMDEIFSTASYLYVLYGMGFGSSARPGPGFADAGEQAQRLIIENGKQAKRLVAGLPKNRDILARIAARDLPAA